MNVQRFEQLRMNLIGLEGLVITHRPKNEEDIVNLFVEVQADLLETFMEDIRNHTYARRTALYNQRYQDQRKQRLVELEGDES